MGSCPLLEYVEQIPPVNCRQWVASVGLVTMQSYKKSGTHLFCGHWNGSPVEIGVTEVLHDVPSSEQLHFHDYHEYYVILEGEGALEVDNSIIRLEAGSTVMVEPGEKHQVVAVGRDGIRWVIIKERSIPDSKHIV